MVERKTTIFCDYHLFVRGWAVLLQKTGTFLGKDEVPGSNPGISSKRKAVLNEYRFSFGAGQEIERADRRCSRWR